MFILWIGSLLLMTSTSSEYVRPLIDYNEMLSSSRHPSLPYFRPRIREQRYVPVNDCGPNSCFVKLNENFNMLTDKGYGISFVLSGMSRLNGSLIIDVLSSTTEVSSEYLYTTPSAEMYYRLVLKNYDEILYNDCANNRGEDRLTTLGDRKPVGVKGIDWDYAMRSSRTFSYGGVSGEAHDCGHWWPTKLQVCVEKALIIQKNRGISTFKMSEQLNLMMEISATFNGRSHKFRYEGDTNEPKTWSITDEITLEMNPIGILTNPLASETVSCLFSIDDKQSVTSSCYATGQVSGKGSFPTQGLGMYQLVDLSRPSSTAFDKTYIRSSEPTYKCGLVDNFANYHNDDHSKLIELFDDSLFEKTTKNVKIGPTNGTGLFSGDDCCIRLVSSSSKLLDTILKNYRTLDDEYGSKMIQSDYSFVINSGIPQLSKIKFGKLIKSPILTSINADRLELMLAKPDYKITKAKIPTMTWYESGAGSFFEIEFEFSGTAANVPIDSKDITLLTREIFVSRSGKVKDTVGFKTTITSILKPSICIGFDNLCITPELINKKKPKDSQTDDPTDDDDQGEHYKMISFFKRLFTEYWMFTLINSFMLFLNIIMVLVFFICIIKLSKRMVVLLLFSSNIKDAQSLFTGIKNDFLLGTRLIRSEGKLDSSPNTITTAIVNNYMFDQILNSVGTLPVIYHAIDQSKCIKKASDATSVNHYVRDYEYELYKGNVSEKKNGEQKFSWGAAVWKVGAEVTYCMNDFITSPISKQGLEKHRDEAKKMKSCRDKMIIRESPYHGYEEQMGSSTTLLVCKDDSAGTFMTMLYFDNQIFFTDIIVSRSKAHGRYQKLAYSICLIHDSSQYRGSLMEFLTKTLLIEGNNLVITGEYPRNDAVIQSCYIVLCPEKCSVVDNRTGKRVFIYSKDVPEDIKVAKKAFLNSVSSTCGKDLLTLVDKVGDKQFSSDLLTFYRSKDDISAFKMADKGLVFKNHFSELNVTGVTTLDHMKKHQDSSCDISKIDSFNEISVFYITNLFVNDELMTIPGVGGPMDMSCLMNVNSANCFTNDDSNSIAILNGDFSNHDPLAGYDMNNNSYKIFSRRAEINITPVGKGCKGRAYVGTSSRLYCSNDCCLMSANGWNTFDVATANSPITFKSFVLLSQYGVDNNKLSVYNLRSGNELPYETISDCFNSIFFEHPFKSSLFYFSAGYLLLIYYGIILIIYLFTFTMTSLTSRKSTRRGLKKSSRSNAMSRMAENIIKGRATFWRNYDTDLSDAENLLESGVYKRTTRKNRLPTYRSLS